jgi:hypothetical protein
MSVYTGLAGGLVGVLLALGSLVMVLVNSPLVGAETSIRRVYLWALVFLLGVFVFGWSVARFASA